MATVARWARELTGLFRESRSYRRVVTIIAALTLVPLLAGLVEGATVGGSALGYAIWFVVTVALAAVVFGVVVWAIAMIWYRSAIH